MRATWVYWDRRHEFSAGVGDVNRHPIPYSTHPHPRSSYSHLTAGSTALDDELRDLRRLGMSRLASRAALRDPHPTTGFVPSTAAHRVSHLASRLSRSGDTPLGSRTHGHSLFGTDSPAPPPATQKTERLKPRESGWLNAPQAGTTSPTFSASQQPASATSAVSAFPRTVSFKLNGASNPRPTVDVSETVNSNTLNRTPSWHTPRSAGR